MAIDRGPWNALVDDDGSNLVGTVWNKDKIKTVLLDPIDAIGQWVDVPFDAANFTASSGTWTVTAGNQQVFRYAILNAKTAALAIVITASSVSASTVRIKITLPAAIQGHASSYYLPTFFNATGVTGAGLTTHANTYLDCLRDVSGTPWPAGGNVYLYITGLFNIP